MNDKTTKLDDACKHFRELDSSIRHANAYILSDKIREPNLKEHRKWHVLIMDKEILSTLEPLDKTDIGRFSKH